MGFFVWKRSVATHEETVVVCVEGLGEVDELGPRSGQEEVGPAEGGLLVVQVGHQPVPGPLDHVHVEIKVQDLRDQHKRLVLE